VEGPVIARACVLCSPRAAVLTTHCRARPAARPEGPGAADLATVRPLGPGGSWGGLGVVRGQLGPWAALRPGTGTGPLGSVVGGWVVVVVGGPDRHRGRGWLLCPSSVLRAGSWRPGGEAARVLGSL
jgi:hypothetical protein